MSDLMIEEIKYTDTYVREDSPIGKKVLERKKAGVIKEHIDIPIGHERNIKVEDEEGVLVLYFHVPEIEDDKYYPIVEWRITQDTLDECDYWPEWKSFVYSINGEQIMERGLPVKAQFFVFRAIQEMREDQDGHFFTDPPFSSSLIKMSDCGIPVIKGSDLDDLKQEALRTMVGASRRRGTDVEGRAVTV